MPTPIGGFEGLIDEIRISNIFRYFVQYEVPKRFKPDEHTVALWHFDEGPGKFSYKDASGHGHTLYRRGVLSFHKIGYSYLGSIEAVEYL
jgi:hypothetical protein